jgi:hypothetical protein
MYLAGVPMYSQVGTCFVVIHAKIMSLSLLHKLNAPSKCNLVDIITFIDRNLSIKVFIDYDFCLSYCLENSNLHCGYICCPLEFPGTQPMAVY